VFSVVNRALEIDCMVAGGGDESSNDGGHPLNRRGSVCFVFYSFLGSVSSFAYGYQPA
jgi:hypothetical protein